MKGNSQFRQALEDAVQICKDAGAVESVEAIATTAACDAADKANDMRLAIQGRGY
jgi:hypothetical protein